MAYDKMQWHHDGDFPAELSPANAATHIGFFLAWAITRDLAGELHEEESAEELAAVRERTMTGRDFLINACDGSLTDEDLNDQGNAFTKSYYLGENTDVSYLDDYRAALTAGLSSDYHVVDDWANFDRLATTVDRRFAQWAASDS